MASASMPAARSAELDARSTAELAARDRLRGIRGASVTTSTGGDPAERARAAPRGWPRHWRRSALRRRSRRRHRDPRAPRVAVAQALEPAGDDRRGEARPALSLTTAAGAEPTPAERRGEGDLRRGDGRLEPEPRHVAGVEEPHDPGGEHGSPVLAYHSSRTCDASSRRARASAGRAPPPRCGPNTNASCSDADAAVATRSWTWLRSTVQISMAQRFVHVARHRSSTERAARSRGLESPDGIAYVLAREAVTAQSPVTRAMRHLYADSCLAG